jgi:hypothetical protein
VDRNRFTRISLLAAALVLAAGLGYVAADSRRGRAPVAVPQVARAEAPLEVAVVPPAASQPSEQRAQDTNGPTPVSAPVVRFAAATHPESPSVRRAVANLNADYDHEMSRLRVLIDQRRNQLDPVTVAIVEKNLQVIDAAIAECKKAIARDPASRFLIESLNQSLQTKVELLRTAALLPSRS